MINTTDWQMLLFVCMKIQRRIMKRPSEIAVPEVTFGIVPPKGYLAITWFGKIVINKKNKEYWEKYPDILKNKTINHERIHIRQAEKTHNSWFCFYCKYIWVWLKTFVLSGFKNSIAYYCNPFEVEAYLNETNRFYQLKLFDFYQKIPVSVYIALYKSSKSFSDFLKQIVKYIEKEFNE